jgi:iron complex transport system substrate-binding protein
MFAQLVASALLLRHLPALAQTPLTVAVGGSPGPNITQRVVSAGAPADMLLLAVAPEKLVGFSSFDFSRQTAIPFHDDIRALPKLGRLAGRASTLLKHSWRLNPIWLLTAVMPMKPGFLRPDK